MTTTLTSSRALDLRYADNGGVRTASVWLRRVDFSCICALIRWAVAGRGGGSRPILIFFVYSRLDRLSTSGWECHCFSISCWLLKSLICNWVVVNYRFDTPLVAGGISAALGMSADLSYKGRLMSDLFWTGCLYECWKYTLCEQQRYLCCSAHLLASLSSAVVCSLDGGGIHIDDDWFWWFELCWRSCCMVVLAKPWYRPFLHSNGTVSMELTVLWCSAGGWWFCDEWYGGCLHWVRSQHWDFGWLVFTQL